MKTSDLLKRTEFFGPEVKPTVPGNYECSTLPNDSGFVFTRHWNGECWISSVTRMPTKVGMHWRGVVPGSVEIGLYPSAIRLALRGSIAPQPTLDDIAKPMRELVAKALYDETMTTP